MPPQSRLEVLRQTLRHLEQSADVSADEPGFVELKRILLGKIAAAEAESGLRGESAQASDAPDEKALPDIGLAELD